MPELRDLPSVDRLLGDTALAPQIQTLGAATVRDLIRAIQQQMRDERRVPDWALQAEAYAKEIELRARNLHYRSVFNMTGTIIHTNLGRALLSPALWQAAEPHVTRPTNLEYDLVAGRRGSRDKIVTQRLNRLIGCEASTIVNNNAAALLIVLNTLALGKNVPVSRGELIEIGGSFRLPELMSRAGCTLIEVGTTNRTHLQDFVGVADSAAMMLKVHPSNYHIQGFSAQVEAAELASLARENNIPSCVDLGAGTLVDLSKWHLPKEPTPQSVLDKGIDLVTFSGDKLLGGVQAGIIVGRKDLVDAIDANPLKRALRADKITLALLEQTLKLYEDVESLPHKLPLLRTLTLPEDTLRQYAQQCVEALPGNWVKEIVESQVQIGSGALPDQSIPSVAVRLQHPELSAIDLASCLRELSTPVIGRVANNSLYLDMRGAERIEQLTTLLSSLRA